uniref:Uncharacterized protein n=1 Tax=Setaria viridis TaxID=4556 RepID=A0A4U6U5Q8_SETVI|nr:hypothetical protein SEVIR_6G198550v2 [Setaria viridis]
MARSTATCAASEAAARARLTVLVHSVDWWWHQMYGDVGSDIRRWHRGLTSRQDDTMDICKTTPNLYRDLIFLQKDPFKNL